MRAASSKPRLAIVTLDLRRDLLAPLRYLSRLDLVHFYRTSAYGDLAAEDFDPFLRRYTTPFDLYRQLVRAKPAVVQGVEPFSFYTQPFLWACYFAARRTKAALLIGTHENRPLDVKFGKARAACLQWLLRYYFARACLIIALNTGAFENVLQCGAPAAQVVRGMWGNWGVDTNEFVPRAARPLNAPPMILFAGRLHEEKGVFILIDGFALVHQELPRARLVVAGDGPARQALVSKIHSIGLSDSVTLLGMIKHRDMPPLFQNADVLCAPSLTTRKWAEQVGSASLQGMSCSVPIVSTRSGAIPEYVPDGVAGLLVEEQNPIALAEALLKVLTRQEMAEEMGRRGREYALAHYDARTNVCRGEQLVLDCLKQE